MTEQEFALRPFPGDLCLPAVALGGLLWRQGSLLTITFILSGRLADVVIPPPAPVPARRWLLWEATCSEFFLALPGHDDYWEFNLSPSGDWNVFHLSGYRQGIQEEPAITTLAVSVARQPDQLSLRLQTDLAAILPADQPWEVAISTVLLHPNGHATFWALIHPAPQPDFHHRAGFILTL